jgi:hypothetical protein
LVDILQLLIYFTEQQITLLMAIVGGYVMESRKEKSGKEIKHLENVHVNDDVECGAVTPWILSSLFISRR